MKTSDSTFTWLRHGQSLADVLDPKRYGGADEDALTEEGEEQVKAISERFARKEIAFDRIVASTLAQARRTAEIIGKRLGLVPAFDPVFRERDNGIMSFQPKEEFDAAHPKPEFESPFWSFEGGESAVALHLRGGAAVAKLVGGKPGNILVVAHGGIINAMVCNMLGIGCWVNGSGVGFKLGDTGVIRIRYRPVPHRWTCLEMDTGM